MIVQDVYLEDWDWTVKVFYAVDTYYMEDILGELDYLGAKKNDLVKTKENLDQIYNVGLTFSNLKDKHSVIVIGISTSPDEFQNTFDHEKGHLAIHIAESLDIDIFGEEFQYLTGEIGQALFPIAKMFLCERRG